MAPTYIPSNNRSQFVKTADNILIVDAYNANPTSMAAALDNFASIDFNSKVLILGDMLELGSDSLAEHKAALAKALAITGSIYLVGKEFSAAAGELGVQDSVRCFDSSDLLAGHLRDNPLRACTILVKGSNGTHLQGLAKIL